MGIKRMKVCFFIGDTNFPTIGGYENLVYSLSEALSKYIDIYIICSKVDKNIPLPPGVVADSSIFSNRLKIKYISFPIDLILIQLKFLSLCIKEKFDIIHAHPSYPSGFYAISSKLLGLPLICTSHGADIQINSEIGYGSRLNLINRLLIKLTLKLADIHTIVSKSMYNDAIEAGSSPSKIKVIYNGINLKQIPESYATDIIKDLSLSEDKFIILFLGRLHIKKCPDDLLKAFSYVIRRIPNSKLVFAGAGDEFVKLKKIAKELAIEKNVIFAGFVSEKEKWDLIKRCDVFVLPSIIEGFAITIMEVMACGKPVIATNIEPFSEIITNGKTGLLVPIHSPEALSIAIIDIANNNKRKVEIGDCARETIKKNFDIRQIALTYLSLYKNLI